MSAHVPLPDPRVGRGLETFRPDRREFLATSVRAGAGFLVGAAGCSAAEREAETAALRGRIVIARRKGLARAGQDDMKRLAAEMLNAAVRQLTGEASPRAAWRRLFGPRDRVGVKVNALAGPRLCPHPAVVDALVEGLRLAGVRDENILIWDRYNRELENCGYRLNARGGVRCFGTDALPGSGYEEEVSMLPHMGSCLSKILTRFCTALVNVSVMKDHDLAGVSGSMKNLFGVIHNPNKYHLNHCDPYVAELSTLPAIRGKARLNVCDALRPQYDGGPSYKPRTVWEYDALLVSTDCVTLDRVIEETIEAKRRAAGLPTLAEAGHPAAHIDTAARLGLGEGDPAKITRLEA